MTVKRLIAAAAGALSLTACATSTPGADGLYATPTGGAPVTPNPTPYSDALVCLSGYARQHGQAAPRVAVGRIADYTGQMNPEGGTRVTQGASLMAISAFAKAGARLVERFDTSVAELELRYANNQLLGDAAEQDGYRQIYAGSIPGSDYYLVGGITELNANIRSNGQDVLAGDSVDSDPSGLFSRRMYVMNVGLDLRLIDSRTLEVVDVVSYQKQIIGRELSAGVFAFFGDVVLDASAGGRSLEPIQLAVRSVIERAVLEMSANLYGVAGPQVCSYDDPLSTYGASGNYTVAYTDTLESNNAYTREDPSRWHDSRDAGVRTYLRGRYE